MSVSLSECNGFDALNESLGLFASTSPSPIQLSSGANYQPAPATIKRLLQWELQNDFTYRFYGAQEGARPVREIIRNTYLKFAQNPSLDITALLCNGTSAGLHLIYRSLLRSGKIAPGDSVCTPGFGFPLVAAIANSLGLKFQECLSLDGFTALPDIDTLTAHIKKNNTKVINLIAPHNPFGLMGDALYYGAIDRLCRDYGVFLIIDVVCLMPWDDHQLLPKVFGAGVASNRTVIIGSMSKSNSLAGIRSGYIVCGRDFSFACIKEIKASFTHPTVYSTFALAFYFTCLLKLNGYNYLHHIRYFEKNIDLFFSDSPVGSQVDLAALSLEAAVTHYTKEVFSLKKIFARNHSVLTDAFPSEHYGVQWQAGFNCVLQAESMKSKSEVGDQFALLKQGVAVLTRRCFTQHEFPDAPYFIRVGLSLPTAQFQAGVNTLAHFYRK